jgi:Ni/Co efflux regulator RcnB
MKNLLIAAFATCLAAAVPTALWAADEQKEPGGGRSAPTAQHNSAPAQHGATSGGGTRGSDRTMSLQHSTQGSTGGTQSLVRDRSTTQTYGGSTTGPSRTESTGTSRVRHTSTRGTTGSTERATTTERTPGGSAGGTTTGTHAKFDVSSRRKNITAHHRYHNGTYDAPQGYSYHRYSYGDRLPGGYFGRDFWILDFADYGLGAPPDGYVWVRYGPDAVLIDEDTGEIVEIVYNQFY